jgi:hypothetical protein
MFDPSRPHFSDQYKLEKPPEDIRRELATLGLEDQRFSPLDFSERLANYVGATIKIRAVEDMRTIRGFGQRLRMALTINRLTGNLYAPEEAAILLHYARSLADLSYDPENHEFLVRIPESLKPPNIDQIVSEVRPASSRVRFSLGRPGRFWRRNYFLSSTRDLAIYRQLSYVACGHIPGLPDSSEQQSSAPLQLLAERPPVRHSPVDEAEYYERDADRRSLWLLRLAAPRPFEIGVE